MRQIWFRIDESGISFNYRLAIPFFVTLIGALGAHGMNLTGRDVEQHDRSIEAHPLRHKGESIGIARAMETQLERSAQASEQLGELEDRVGKLDTIAEAVGKIGRNQNVERAERLAERAAQAVGNRRRAEDVRAHVYSTVLGNLEADRSALAGVERYFEP